MPALRALWKVRGKTFKWESPKKFSDRIMYGVLWLFAVLTTPIYLAMGYLFLYGLSYLVFVVTNIATGNTIDTIFSWGILGLIPASLFVLVTYIPPVIKDMMEDWDYSRPYIQKLGLWSFHYKFKGRFKRLGFTIKPDLEDDRNRFIIADLNGNITKNIFIQPMTVNVLGPNPIITITSFNGATTKYKYTPYNPFTKLRWFLLKKGLTIIMLSLKHKVRGSQYGELALRGASFNQLDALLTLKVSAPMSVKFMELDIPVSEYENLKDLPLEWVSKTVS